MKLRQDWSRSQPRRSSSLNSWLPTVEETEKPFDALRVERENWVSYASLTRVTEGCASLVEISCMAARPASQLGNRYACMTRFSGSRCTCTVTSVMTPRRPSEPSTISRVLGPVEVLGRARTTSVPPGWTTRIPREMRAMSPYLSDCMPDDRVATQPPRVLWVKLSG